MITYLRKHYGIVLMFMLIAGIVSCGVPEFFGKRAERSPVLPCCELVPTPTPIPTPTPVPPTPVPLAPAITSGCAEGVLIYQGEVCSSFVIACVTLTPTPTPIPIYRTITVTITADYDPYDPYGTTEITARITEPAGTLFSTGLDTITVTDSSGVTVIETASFTVENGTGVELTFSVSGGTILTFTDSAGGSLSGDCRSGSAGSCTYPFVATENRTIEASN